VNRLTSDALLGLYAPSRAVFMAPDSIVPQRRSERGANRRQFAYVRKRSVRSRVRARSGAAVLARDAVGAADGCSEDLDRADRLRGAQVSGAGARASDGSYTCGRMRERECRSHQYVAPAVLTRMLKQASHAGSICADCIAAG
jgi:hypothetical protein